MKRNVLLLTIVALSTFLIFQSCKKDNLLEDRGTEKHQELDMALYDEFGPKLEKSIDRALENENFKTVLLMMTQERPLGDFEILMKDFLAYESSKGESIKSILLDYTSDLFEESTLDNFLQNYPSLVIATRGNVNSWAEGTFRAPTVFVPSTFDEKIMRIDATKNGEKVELQLDKPFEDVAIVMHISERHDKTGEPLFTVNMADERTSASNHPSINMSDDMGASLRSCGPEPTSCSDPVILNFEVKLINGGIRLEYEIDNFPEELCYWGRIRFERIGPDLDGDGQPDIDIINRYAHQFNYFYDNTALPNTEYTYTMTARTVYQTDNGWVTCAADEEIQQTITANDVLPRMATFRGENMNSSTLKYNWYPLAGIPVTKYRLRRETGSGYDEIPGSPYLPDDDNFAFYNHPASDRGSLVEVQMQYKTSGALWSGDYFDRSYASYRDPNQPLYWYGVRMPNLEDYELSLPGGESILYGAPEVRLFAIRGAGSLADRQAIQVQHKIIFTKSVCDEGSRIRIRPTEWTSGGWFNLNVPGEYFVDVSMKAVDIVNSWDNYLIGTAIKVVLTETDATEVVVDDWSTQSTTEVELSAEVGYKKIYNVDSMVVDIDTIPTQGDSIMYDSTMLYTSVGVESSWKSTETISYKYPSDDVEMDVFTIRYHHEFMLTSNKNLYGYNRSAGSNANKTSCALLKQYLE